MSEAKQPQQLVQVYHADNEWEGNLLVGYLRENGIEAMLQAPPSMPPLDMVENLSGSEKINGVFVLEHEAEHARGLLKEFQSTGIDQRTLEETAMQKPNPHQETIGQLRGALRDERKTFDFLGWVSALFLGAAALLWAIWPAWLKIAPSLPGFRWLIVILLALAVGFAGSWASRRLK